ncbi:hypothetical protein GCM10009433_23290 [Psychroflexus lacisalsi]|uniref:Uncharacterized protein n=1 Tax=Psychroflexus lacisalsi TaxID=503928 RepID=A0ABN1KCT1_9FLAO
MSIEEIIAVRPRTKPMLAIFEPITFPSEISEKPDKAACKLTRSSGAEVANETTVRPMIIFDILNLNERATEDLTKNSPPITKRINPKITKNISIDFF